jgi:hypothetical protein
MLGSGERTCPTCGKVFDDGFREWPELSFDQKVQHVFPVPIMGIIGGFLVCAAIAIFTFIQARGSVSWLSSRLQQLLGRASSSAGLSWA